MAFFCGHLSAVGTAKNTLNGGPKFASARWFLSSQSKRLSGVSILPNLLVPDAEKLSILSSHLAAVSLAKDDLHRLYDSGWKRGRSFLQRTAIFKGNRDVFFNVHGFRSAVLLQPFPLMVSPK